MARTSVRRRFLVVSLASSALAILLFAGTVLVVARVWDEGGRTADGESFPHETLEVIAGALAVAVPIALVVAAVAAVALSRRSARPLEDAIRAARETTAHDLRRALPVPARDDELRDLVVALNELFARLDDGFGALARFAADASHELRTPLAVTATELEVALRHTRSVDEWEATGRTTLHELRRMASLVEGLLTLARAGADAPAAREVTPIGERVDAVVAQLAEAAERAGVALHGPVDDVRAPVAGNPVMIETAVRNLIENAIAATPRGGCVEVGVAAIGAEVEVVVDDDGPGVGADPEALFAPFRRGPERVDARARGPGAGLGLAIVRRIAASHGGTVTAGPSQLGGARFALRLPAAIPEKPGNRGARALS
jgi:signal transduction histidine kinase